MSALVNCGANADTCVRPPAKQFAMGAIVELNDSTDYPCTMKVVNTGIKLTPTDDVRPLGYAVARDRDGRFYTSPADTGAQLNIWNADGKFLRNVGQAGNEPGALASGTKYLQFDTTGRFYIADNKNRWSVFSPTFEFVASIPATESGIRGLGNTGVLLNDGTYLSSVRAKSAAFRVFDFNNRLDSAPPVLREFGPPSPAGISSSRRIAYAGDDTFWAGPLSNAGQGYVLEQWRTDGTLLQTIRRSVPWVLTGAAGTQLGGGVPYPDMQLLYDDGTGILIINWLVHKKEYASLTPEERNDYRPRQARDKAIEVYLEAIDTKAGVVLASTGPLRPSQSFSTFAIGYFAGTREGYVRDENSIGVVSIRITKTLLLRR